MDNRRLRILLIADVGADADHSAVEGLFKTRPEMGIHVDKVFFSKAVKKPVTGKDRMILPHRCRRRGLLRALSPHLTCNRYDAVVVRNLFSVVAQLHKDDLGIRIGFWESFPHSHRRVEQAIMEKRALWRKRLEYRIAARRERRLIEQCAFYLPITETHRRKYYPELEIPVFPAPMGFDFERNPIGEKPLESGPIHFVYIGSVDELRSVEVVNRAFMEIKDDFCFDYFSNSENKAVERIKSLKDQRIRFFKGLPRQDLFRRIASADVGVCFFPHTKTYITASPTKTIEYGALGLTVLVNPMPEYDGLIDENCAYISDFETRAIGRRVRMILRDGRDRIVARGRELQQRVYEQRNYADMATNLFDFIAQLANKGH